MPILTSAVAIISVFTVSITVHELGHYAVAKKSGVVVPAFAVGFGPKLIRWFWRGTEFSVRLFPIGGFVQLAGEIPQESLFRIGERIAVKLDAQGKIRMLGEPGDIPGAEVGVLRDLDLTTRLQITIETGDGTHTYQVVPHAKFLVGPRNSVPIVAFNDQVRGKPLWKRMLIILAGPLMNFLLAGFLFAAINLHIGMPLNSSVIGGIVPNSPSSQVGLVAGDRIVSVNGVSTSSWIQVEQLVSADTLAKPVTIVVSKGGEEHTFMLTPKLVMVNGKQVPQIGIVSIISHNPVAALKSGFVSVYSDAVRGIHLYGQVLQHHQFSSLSGPVGIADQISQEAQSGFWYVVMMTGLLSLNLGLFNLIPIPALDGGRLLFMIVEMMRGKAIDPRKESFVHFAGFAVLMLFSLAVTYHDVTQIF
ncbi:site-2 protease family protein [Alicyclobacillus tolerans]|uniref:M50 family metallopeptidase n=1 Tax=Alicyclobacillus tolerans TaxID=90970 RepID=UPI001F01274A|nr:site-2 protease family protein [Alicyclobacillus tolerans]MCF8568283.1 site-2 protease family protein [Alicyclobacillus tolerans]